MVVVMRTRFGRPDFGRPADGRRSSTTSRASLSGDTREPSSAIIKYVSERDSVSYKKIARFLRYHRLHVNSNLGADCRAPSACRRACRQCAIRSRSAWIMLNWCRQVSAAPPARSSRARIDLVAHELGNRWLALNCVEVDLIRDVRKPDDDAALMIDLNAAITQPTKLVVIRHAT